MVKVCCLGVDEVVDCEQWFVVYYCVECCGGICDYEEVFDVWVFSEGCLLVFEMVELYCFWVELVCYVLVVGGFDEIDYCLGEQEVGYCWFGLLDGDCCQQVFEGYYCFYVDCYVEVVQCVYDFGGC